MKKIKNKIAIPQKIKYKIVIPIVLVLGLLAYIFLTPIGALRFAVFRQAFPKYETTLNGRLKLILFSVTLKVDPKNCTRPPKALREGDQTVYNLTDFPFEALTDMPWDSWIVSKYGIFYWGDYFSV